MPNRSVEIEKLGIEHIPLEDRHGSAGRVFTLWFAANLTVADYVIGVLTVQVFGLTVLQALPVLLVGNVLGGLVLGLSAAMGPKLGYPQMMSSRSSFGGKGNYLFGGLNWASTAGWFAVNTILGAEALQAAYPAADFYVTATLLVAVQVLIAVYGHDFIHLFEMAMSIVLGLLFVGVFILALQHPVAQLGGALPASAPSFSSVGVTLAAAFSYLMSWSPYASDYSRYLSPTTSGRRVAALALVGGAGASFVVEVIGALVGRLTAGQGFFAGLYQLTGSFGPLAILAIILGATAANTLNIYTNSLSALVLGVRARRWVTVFVGGLLGLALSLVGRTNFVANYENFLLVLDYWITPWLGIVLVDYFAVRRTTADSTENAPAFDLRALAAYAIAVLVSVPFMVPAIPLPLPFGVLAYFFGGADFSYFVSFGAACVFAYFLRGSTS